MSAELILPGMADINLYPWQEEAVEALRQGIRADVRNQLLVAPTGAGKTVLASHLIRETYAKGGRAVFVCDRVELINQTSRTFDAYGIPHGVIQADHWRWRPWERVQLASVQTLQRRKWPEDPSVIVIDEAHTVYAATRKRIEGQTDTRVIGLTATPFARGLGRIFPRVVNVRTTRQLIEDGYLSDYVIYSASEPDMKGAKVKAGEWTEKEASERAMPIVGDCVSEYLRHGPGKKFICFGVDVRHCEELARQFLAAGVMVGLYTYRNVHERDQLLEDFRDPRGHLQGLISVSALAKGFDAPCVEVVILARPLRKALAEHIQMLGRGLRRDPDNPGKRCIVLDHAGNCRRFWSAMNDFFTAGVEELDMGTKAERKSAPEKPEREPMKCPKCTHVHDPRPMCPQCGHEYPRRSAVEHVPGTLSELTGHEAGSRDDKQSVYSQLLQYGDSKGWSEGAAAHRFRERYGHWPNGLSKKREPVSRKTHDWITSRLIAWARGKGKAA